MLKIWKSVSFFTLTIEKMRINNATHLFWEEFDIDSLVIEDNPSRPYICRRTRANSSKLEISNEIYYCNICIGLFGKFECDSNSLVAVVVYILVGQLVKLEYGYLLQVSNNNKYYCFELKLKKKRQFGEIDQINKIILTDFFYNKRLKKIWKNYFKEIIIKRDEKKNKLFDKLQK